MLKNSQKIKNKVENIRCITFIRYAKHVSKNIRLKNKKKLKNLKVQYRSRLKTTSSFMKTSMAIYAQTLRVSIENRATSLHVFVRQRSILTPARDTRFVINENPNMIYDYCDDAKQYCVPSPLLAERCSAISRGIHISSINGSDGFRVSRFLDENDGK